MTNKKTTELYPDLIACVHDLELNGFCYVEKAIDPKELSDLKKRGDEIIIAPRYATEGTSTGRDPAAAMVFSVVGGQDKNADGMIAVGGELTQNPVFSNTVADAIKLAGSDMMVSPTEALHAVIDKAGKISAEDLEIVYHPPQK